LPAVDARGAGDPVVSGEMVAAGVTDAIVEATSHGLALNRVRGCLLTIAIVTNITSEHLEFHRRERDNVAAKALLLEALRDNRSKPAGDSLRSMLT